MQAEFLTDQAHQRPGECGGQGEDQPIIAQRRRRDLRAPALERAALLELWDVARVLVLEQHLVADRLGSEDLPRQHERIVMPAQPSTQR